MKEKENSKDKLLRTASQLFQVQGYHATGLNQITKESGAPKGSLYYHFPNGKEQLAQESVELTAQFVSKQLLEGLRQASDPAEAIQNLIGDMANRFEKKEGKGGIPIASVALETSLISEPLRITCQNAYESFQNLFTQKLKDSGMEKQRAEELGIVINAMIEGAFLLSFTRGDAQPLRLIAEKVPVLLR